MLRNSLLIILFTFTQIINAQQLAFPNAEGGGRFSTGGRGGTVYEVTNLNDAGAGSLRDAVSQPNRTVVFRVSGEIKLLSRLIVKQNNITIAGQTAPGDGICVTGYTFNIQASNIIVRYIRCRLGDANNIEDDAMNCWSGNFQNIIIDHCSMSWSIDETATFYDIKNFTLQWCIISESLFNSIHNKGEHGYAGIWGGENATYHHNLLAHHTSRAPRFQGTRYKTQVFRDSVDYRNNVVYNWGNINSTYGGENGSYNMVNNYYKAGPATPGSLTASSTSNKRNRILNYTGYYLDGTDTVRGGRFYINGNFVAGFPTVTTDNWTQGVQKDSYWNNNALIVANKQTNPYPFPNVTTQTAEEAYLLVLDKAGAIFPKRDTIDRRIVKETRTGTATFEGATYKAQTSAGITHPSGIIDSPTDVGGVPVYNSTTPPVDTDKDGMPDAWETSKGLNPNNSEDRNTFGAGGYTQLEIYLNSLGENGVTSTKDLPPSVFNLYPSIASTTLTLDFDNNFEEKTIHVFDIQGVRKITQKVSSDEMILDISFLPKGLYLIEYQNERGKAVKKFMKL